MSPNIPMNTIKHSGECRQTLRGMSPNIPGNIIKHSRKCRQTFRGMLPLFGVKQDNYWAGSHLESCQTSTMELFCKNSQQPFTLVCHDITTPHRKDQATHCISIVFVFNIYLPSVTTYKGSSFQRRLI